MDRDAVLNRPPPRREEENRQLKQALEVALSRNATLTTHNEAQASEIALLRQQVAVNHGGDFAHRRFYHPV